MIMTVQFTAHIKEIKNKHTDEHFDINTISIVYTAKNIHLQVKKSGD
jgi:glutathionyl-hydroquinone reductase